MRRLLFLAMLLASCSGMADSIYRTTDAEGNVVFTDAPNATSRPAQPVEIQRPNIAEPTPVIEPLPDPTTPSVKEEAPPYTITIVSPTDETSIPMGPGNFSVSVIVEPGLQKYEGLQLFVDGKPWGDPQRDTLWDLTNVFRGEHNITVSAVNKAGETRATSAPVRVYVHRPSSKFRK